jgi:SpoVK/Ycf46/Vps4 family AAA+-type ATPase
MLLSISSFEEQFMTYISARFPVIQLVTSEEERALETLHYLAKKLHKTLRLWSCTRGLYSYLLEKGNSEELRDPLACLDSILESSASALYVLLDFHPFLTNPQLNRKIREVAFKLKTSKKTLILLSSVETLPPELFKEVTTLDFPLPTSTELASTLEDLKNSLGAKGQVQLTAKEKESLIKAAQGLTLNEFENVLALSLIRNHSIDVETIPFVLEEKKKIIRKSGILEYIPVETGFEKVGGYAILKSWLHQRRQALSNKAKECGLPAPKGIFLLGIQGCGKSLIAKTMACDWQLPLLRLDVGRVFSGVVGSSEHNIRRAIQLAESLAPCILWIDEIEKAFAGVGSSNFSDAGTAARVFATFMTWLQEKNSPVFLVATANDLTVLPPEFIRKGRFDEVFFLDLPGPQERQEVFQIHLKRFHYSTSHFDLDSLVFSSKGFSGAEIEQAIIDGLYDAFEAQRSLSTQDILVHLEQTYPLSKTMGESITQLREWARHRARPASTLVELSF